MQPSVASAAQARRRSQLRCWSTGRACVPGKSGPFGRAPGRRRGQGANAGKARLEGEVGVVNLTSGARHISPTVDAATPREPEHFGELPRRSLGFSGGRIVERAYLRRRYGASDLPKPASRRSEVTKGELAGVSRQLPSVNKSGVRGCEAPPYKPHSPVHRRFAGRPVGRQRKKKKKKRKNPPVREIRMAESLERLHKGGLGLLLPTGETSGARNRGGQDRSKGQGKIYTANGVDPQIEIRKRQAANGNGNNCRQDLGARSTPQAE